MLTKKVRDLGKFTIILSVGSIINSLLGYIFRFIALLLLKDGDYGLLAITIRTFGVLIPFSSFMLHIPLTREIREANQEKRLKKIIQNFAVSYTLTSLFSFFLFIIVEIFFLNFINIPLIVFLALSLIFYSFSEFFIGLSNGYIMPIKGQIILIIGNLVSSILALLSIFIQSMQELNLFIIFFGIGYLCSFLLGLSFYKGEVKEFIFNDNLIEKKMIKNNIKNSSFMLSTTFIKDFKYWIISVFAFSLLGDLSFKIFDLTLMIISVIDIVTYSLTTAINSKEGIEELSTMNFIKKNLIPFLILNILIEMILFLTNLDIIVLNMILGDVPYDAILFIRIGAMVIMPLVISAFFGGKILNKKKYPAYLISSIFGLTGGFIFFVSGYYFDISSFLLIGFIFERLIFSIILMIFDSKE
jgi:hypothetical protein